MTRTAFALAVLATPALAGPYDGTYKQAANSECALVGVDGGAVRIDDGIFYGVEVECRMSDPVNVVDMDALLYSMQCSGEDQIFTERAMVMDKAQDDGIIMVWNGYAFVYDRCADPDAAPVANPAVDTATTQDGLTGDDDAVLDAAAEPAD